MAISAISELAQRELSMEIVAGFAFVRTQKLFAVLLSGHPYCLLELTQQQQTQADPPPLLFAPSVLFFSLLLMSLPPV